MPFAARNTARTPRFSADRFSRFLATPSATASHKDVEARAVRSIIAEVGWAHGGPGADRSSERERGHFGHGIDHPGRWGQRALCRARGREDSRPPRGRRPARARRASSSAAWAMRNRGPFTAGTGSARRAFTETPALGVELGLFADAIRRAVGLYVRGGPTAGLPSPPVLMEAGASRPASAGRWSGGEMVGCGAGRDRINPWVGWRRAPRSAGVDEVYRNRRAPQAVAGARPYGTADEFAPVDKDRRSRQRLCGGRPSRLVVRQNGRLDMIGVPSEVLIWQTATRKCGKMDRRADLLALGGARQPPAGSILLTDDAERARRGRGRGRRVRGGSSGEPCRAPAGRRSASLARFRPPSSCQETSAEGGAAGFSERGSAAPSNLELWRRDVRGLAGRIPATPAAIFLGPHTPEGSAGLCGGAPTRGCRRRARRGVSRSGLPRGVLAFMKRTSFLRWRGRSIRLAALGPAAIADGGDAAGLSAQCGARFAIPAQPAMSAAPSRGGEPAGSCTLTARPRGGNRSAQSTPPCGRHERARRDLRTCGRGISIAPVRP